MNSRTNFNIMPDDTRKAISEYVLKYYGVFIEDKNITEYDGTEIKAVLKGFTFNKLELKNQIDINEIVK